MSMSTSVYGIRPPNERFNQMYAIWEACSKASIPIPLEVRKFFNDENPDPAGVVVILGQPTVRRYNTESGNGCEVTVDELPADVKIIRFVNSW